jgi:oligopeptidase B
VKSASVDGTVPPAAARWELVHELHGVRRADAYAWLRDTANPDVLAHLAAERSYYDAATQHLRPKVKTLSEEMSARLLVTDWSISYKRVRFSYYTLTPDGSEYAQLCRGGYPPQPAHDAAPEPAQVLLDPNRLAACSPDLSQYFELGLTLVSPDERLLAYSVDMTGDEVYALRFRDLETGDDLPDVVARTYYGGAWSADSSTFFYTVHDHAYRPHQVWRHRLGTPVSDDVLVLAEDDERFDLDVRGCRSGDVIVVWSESRDTSEVWLLDAHRPEAPPRCVEPRRTGLEYECEHARTPDGDVLFIVTNYEATEFRLMSAQVADPGLANWVEVIGEDSAERLNSVTAFSGHLVVSLRRDGALMLRSFAFAPDDGVVRPGRDIAASIPAGNLQLDENPMFDVSDINVIERSYTVPATWYSVDLDTGERALLRRQPVPGYQPEQYVSERLSVPVGDGLAIPVTLVRHVDTSLDGTAPCLLYAYGAYESCDEPELDPGLPSLLDRGVVFAHAHVRGGGEGGRRWWLDGKLDRKQHTFSDHIAVANHLADGVVDGDRIVTRGLSAGGLLQGVVFSQAPDRWRGVIAEVPFVDVVTSMLDPSIPLTVNERDEWGDPRRPADFAWMLAYSPYDNAPAAGGRPDLLVTGALHDPRVMVSEPAKWVAALRFSDPDWSPRCVFRVELGEGAHVGPSGRYAHLRYEAEIYAWALERFDHGD